MIHNWLLKHRWVNEIGKLIAACYFSYFAYSAWVVVDLVSADNVVISPGNIISFGKGMFILGIFGGLVGLAALVLIIDLVVSVYHLLTNKTGSEVK